ncbi:hypothetical protein Gotur_006673, partial [Gossypium turneri]
MKNNFQEISFNHVPRLANEVAHVLATEKLKGGKSIYQEGEGEAKRTGLKGEGKEIEW